MNDAELLFEFNLDLNRLRENLFPSTPDEFDFLQGILGGLREAELADISILRLFADENFGGLDPNALKSNFAKYSLKKSLTMALIGVTSGEYESSLLPVLAIWGANEREKNLYIALKNYE